MLCSTSKLVVPDGIHLLTSVVIKNREIRKASKLTDSLITVIERTTNELMGLLKYLSSKIRHDCFDHDITKENKQLYSSLYAKKSNQTSKTIKATFHRVVI